jgi:hypothetical protein
MRSLKRLGCNQTLLRVYQRKTTYGMMGEEERKSREVCHLCVSWALSLPLTSTSSLEFEEEEPDYVSYAKPKGKKKKLEAAADDYTAFVVDSTKLKHLVSMGVDEKTAKL